MQLVRRTFKYKAKVSKSVMIKAEKVLELCRTLYNLALEQRIINYRQFGKSLSYYGQAKELPTLKEQFPEFKEIPAQTAQEVLQRLDRVYKSFFRRAKSGDIPGFPRFKSRNRYSSFTLTQAGWKLEGRRLTLTNIGTFKLFLSRPIQGRIKTITIKRSKSGAWFVFFSCDDVPKKVFPPATKEVGIDVGLKFFAVDSDGLVTKNPRFFKKTQDLLAQKQRELSSKQLGSNNSAKARVLVAKAYEKVSNQRMDFLHKLANYYVARYARIYIEDLCIQKMLEGGTTPINRSINDASWGLFFNLLSYKAEEAGRIIGRINPYKTTQKCSQCGKLVPKSLSDRVHHCPFCGFTAGRDFNASLNILRSGQDLAGVFDSVRISSS